VVVGPYPVVVRLHAIAAANWRVIDGEFAARGINPLTLRPDRFCHLIWYWAIQRIPAEDVDQWVADMEKPLPTATPKKRKPTQRELDLEAEGFMALYAQVNAT
jgi:hypothetical protein